MTASTLLASFGSKPRASEGSQREKGDIKMRSDLIFGALAHVKNRYQLCQLASKATRKLHKPNTRLQDTTNDVLLRFHHSDPAAPMASAGSATLQERRAA
jgi:hypothetical protein